MGSTGFSSVDYTKAAGVLRSSGKSFARAATARATGNFKSIAEHLDPRKLKNGVRECCFAPGFSDALPIIVSIDATGSMDQVPFTVQAELPKLIELLLEQGVSDRPNVLFMAHDDEQAIGPDACFQISQFETGASELLGACNELVIPHNGGGNRGESYHLAVYAAARHTRLEAHERDGSKGFLFLIGDEEPIIGNGDPLVQGTSPEIARECFGDSLEAEVPLVKSLMEAGEKFHIFLIRPHHTSHGQNPAITKAWRDLFRAAGINAENVQEVADTSAIISTIALTVGTILGADRSELVSVLQSKGAAGIDAATSATQALVPVAGALLAKAAQVSGNLPAVTAGRVRS